ncbi:MAG: uroporphyrinogen-III synthase [Deinococcales bacterium]
MLTHSEGRFDGLAEGLRRRGHEVVHAPLIVTRPRSGEDARADASELLALPWLLFTSRSAVEAWAVLGVGWTAPDGHAPRLGAVGRQTASALRKQGAEPALVAERSSRAAGLAEAFLEHPAAAGPVGLPQGDRARPTLRRALEEMGFETRPLVLYETVTQPWTGEAEGSERPGAGGATELIVLASPSAAEALPGEVARRATLVAIGPTTAAALEHRGLPCRQASTPSVGGVLAEVDAVLAEPGGAGPDESGAVGDEGGRS